VKALKTHLYMQLYKNNSLILAEIDAEDSRNVIPSAASGT
jgi:hypothetical protein